MANINKIQIDDVDYDLMDETAREKIGDLSKLETTNKGSLVEAINDAAQSGSGTVSDEQIAQAVESYLEENPVEPSTLNSTASALLIAILRNGVYSTDQSANITALEAALASGGSGTPEPPASDVEQNGTILSIVSGVTVSQTGSVLAIA